MPRCLKTTALKVKQVDQIYLEIDKSVGVKLLRLTNKGGYMEYDYLKIENDDKKVLSHLAEMGEQLKQLFAKMQEAQVALDYAKKEYEHYANVVLPSEMLSIGIDSITLQSGGKLSVKHNYYCQPNKNAVDKQTICDWLKAHAGAHLITHEAKVAAEDIDVLRDANIPFIEEQSVNTLKLKSFLKDGIGATTGVQLFSIDDIPACAHFQDVTTVELEV